MNPCSAAKAALSALFYRHFMESFFMQQNLYFLPDPQGHGSFGMIFFDARRTGSLAQHMW